MAGNGFPFLNSNFFCIKLEIVYYIIFQLADVIQNILPYLEYPKEQVLPLGWEERLHLQHGWMGSRSTGWEDRRGLPSGWRARDSEWGDDQDLPHGWLGRHILQPQEVQCRGKTKKELCKD